jgi:hypothetical protein
MNQSCVEGVLSNHIDILMTSIVQPTLRWPPVSTVAGSEKAGLSSGSTGGMPSHLHHRLAPFR